ncbi:sigma-70 family RNA polymerase sigma factor [Aquisphaera giovannonii]|uniref:sigma-70 family RNA polymerase sigma factor n=1 Tax=Aquisphaera giovannonii TaxID=406548 RepID=UPI00143DD28C|nr:sigma-70 family RNA polymerase sigma factor [Aquisphaera giovannonii]
MTAPTIADVHAQLEALFDRGALGALTDAQLLGRFLGGASEDAEAAFAALVRRHAAMVYRVCLATLGHRQDAEDAAQAVFLVLARRARSVRRSESAASWLHGVARRTALRARRDALRRETHERRRAETMASITSPTTPPADVWDDLHREIDRLPEAYRAAIVLRHLEGLPHDECARRLGCPLRTFQSRLLRARDRLRDRLASRGIGLAAILPEVPHWTAIVGEFPAAWIEATARSARAFAAGQAGAGASPDAIALARSIAGPMSTIAPIAMTAVIAASVCAVAIAPARSRGGPPARRAEVEPQVRPAASARAAEEQAKQPIEVHVVEKAGGTPIEGAEVVVMLPHGGDLGYHVRAMRAASRYVTDAKGSCRVEIPSESPGDFEIRVRKPGFVDRTYSHGVPLQGPIPPTPLPPSHTFELERGTTIGGVVKRRDGEPIAGARVFVRATSPIRGTARDSEYSSIVGENGRAVTDGQGRWRFDGMPSTWTRLSVVFWHPDYVLPGLLPFPDPPSEEGLRALRAETILDEGLAVGGRVIDENGRPVAGATVTVAGAVGWRSIVPGIPSATTDAEGRYRFAHIPAGLRYIRATAPGRPPGWADDVIVGPGTKPVEIRLGPSASPGRVPVDSDGRQGLHPRASR